MPSAKLPTLDSWQPTADHLHLAAQVLAAARSALVSRQPNHLHLSLQVEPRGLTTGKLPNGAALVLDFGAAALHYEADETGFSLPLAGYSQSTLATALFYQLATVNLVVTPKEALDDQTPFAINTSTSADFAHALYDIYTATARFRARLYGMMTPIVVWAHHFDLSFLWFAALDDDEHQPHLNFGFAPFSPGLPRPYLYAYAYPMPADALSIPLPAPARWHTEGWTGVLIEYDTLVAEGDPQAKIEALWLGIFEALRGRLGS